MLYIYWTIYRMKYTSRHLKIRVSFRIKDFTKKGLFNNLQWKIIWGSCKEDKTNHWVNLSSVQVTVIVSTGDASGACLWCLRSRLIHVQFRFLIENLIYDSVFVSITNNCNRNNTSHLLGNSFGYCSTVYFLNICVR